VHHQKVNEPNWFMQLLQTNFTGKLQTILYGDFSSGMFSIFWFYFIFYFGFSFYTLHKDILMESHDFSNRYKEQSLNYFSLVLNEDLVSPLIVYSNFLKSFCLFILSLKCKSDVYVTLILK
jgi:hypothetical protein